MKGGSTSQQTRSLMQVLGGITFVVAIVYGLYVATRDPDVWGNNEWLATVRVILLFLTAIVFYQIADSIGRVGTGYGGGKGKGKDDCAPAGHCPPSGHHSGGGHSGGHHGYSYGNGPNVASVGSDDLTDTN